MSETSASHSIGPVPRPPTAPVPPLEPEPLELAPQPPDPPEPLKPEPPAGEPRPLDRGLVKISDPEQMKALAHPARMAVFDYLALRRTQGFDGATATEIAEVAGMTPSAMSYHLRTLAKAGFIEEAPSRGDARERLWRLGIHSFSISADADASESDKAIERTMGQAFREQQDRSYKRWMEGRFDEDPKLREASLTQQGHVRLTIEEAAEFARRYQELEQEYVDRTLERIEKGAGAEDGTVVFHVLFRFFPRI